MMSCQLFKVQEDIKATKKRKNHLIESLQRHEKRYLLACAVGHTMYHAKHVLLGTCTIMPCLLACAVGHTMYHAKHVLLGTCTIMPCLLACAVGHTMYHAMRQACAVGHMYHG